MPTTPSQHQSRIDQQMEEASELLVRRSYFEAEKLCASALRRALGIQDYDRAARICLPLQEARRQKRDQAIEAGAVFLIDAELPLKENILAGCYLVCPPRVGVDGRNIRDAADEAGVPVMVLVREPATKEGYWPLVAVGPITVRERVAPPRAPMPVDHLSAGGKGTGRGKAGGRTKKGAAAPREASGTPSGVNDLVSLPPPEWFLTASEALGDAAIASCASITQPDLLVEALALRLAALPEHEKLHQQLADAARAATREPSRRRRAGAAHRTDEFGQDFEDLDNLR